MRPNAKPVTDKILAAWRGNAWDKIAPRWAGPIRELIDEVLHLRQYVRFLEMAFLRERAQRVELDRQVKPTGRVLVVDCPAGPGERCEGETLIYADGRIDLYTTRCPVGVSHPLFDEVLEAVLFEAPNRFKGMPGELSIRTRSLVRYFRDLRSEAAAMGNAKLAAEVTAALNKLRDELNETIKDESQDGAQTNAVQAEAVKAETVTTPAPVQETVAARTAAPAAPSGLPW